MQKGKTVATHPETSQSKEIILPRFEYLQVLQAANTGVSG
jgi:hypothetical protein